MKKSFTLIELLVVIAIIAILAGMLLPALNKARATSFSAKCLSNQKQVAQGLLAYTGDNFDMVPKSYDSASPVKAWNWKLHTGGYVPTKVFVCPAIPFRNEIELTYARIGNDWYPNAYGFASYFRVTRLKNASSRVAYLDGVLLGTNISCIPTGGLYTVWGGFPNGEGIPMAAADMEHEERAWGRHHNGKFNVSWWDGHVTSAGRGQILREQCNADWEN